MIEAMAISVTPEVIDLAWWMWITLLVALAIVAIALALINNLGRYYTAKWNARRDEDQ